MDKIFIEEKLLPRLTFNPGLALTGFRTTRPCIMGFQTFPKEVDHYARVYFALLLQLLASLSQDVASL